MSKNEAATRAALIDPVLRALGWDTAAVNLVLPEYAVSNKQRPDYFLRRKNGETHIVIEAKKLGEDLDKLGHTGKLIGYAFTLKPAYHFVTDGLKWHCYSPSHSQYEPYAHIVLSADNLLTAALQLLQLLDATHGGHGLPMPKGNISALPTVKTQPAPAQPTASQLTKKAIAKRPYQQLTVALILGSSFGKPAWLRLPDGTEYPLKSWRDILVKSVELVLGVCPDLKLPLVDKAGKETN